MYDDISKIIKGAVINPDSTELNKGMDKYWKEKERTENIRFWIPVIISLAAILLTIIFESQERSNKKSQELKIQAHQSLLDSLTKKK